MAKKKEVIHLGKGGGNSLYPYVTDGMRRAGIKSKLPVSTAPQPSGVTGSDNDGPKPPGRKPRRV